MKIIQKGVKPKKYPWIGKAHCAWCGTIVELTESDAKDVRGWDDDQRDGMSVTMVCPVCEEERHLHVQGTGWSPYER